MASVCHAHVGLGLHCQVLSPTCGVLTSLPLRRIATADSCLGSPGLTDAQESACRLLSFTHA